MATPYGIDFGNVLGTVDAVRTARMQQQNFLRQQEREQREDERTQRLETARGNALSGNRRELFALAPQEAMEIERHFFTMDEAKRKQAAEKARENAEMEGKLSAYVLAAPTPDEKAQRYQQVRANLPPELAQSMPEQFDEGYVNYSLAKAAGMDHLLSEIARGRQHEAIGNLLAPTAQMGGEQVPPVDQWGRGHGQTGTAPEGFNLPPGGMSRARSSQFDPMFNQAEQQFRLPAGYLARTAEIESGFNPTAKNPNSSAAGLFQFITSTARQYGVDPMNPESATMGAARLAADNAQQLRGVLGRDPTAAELYLAHQQGAGGAARLLSQPHVRAVDIVGEDAVRLNGGNPNMTAGEFAGLWLNKFGQMTPEQQADPRNNPIAQPLMEAMASPDVSAGARNVLAEIFDRVAPQPAERQNLMAVAPGTTVFDPNAQAPVFTAPRSEEDGFRMATPEEAARYGAQAGQFGPDRRFYPINPPSGMTVYGPDGQPIVQTGTTQKPFTEGQSKDNVFATRAAGALPILDQLGGSLLSRTEHMAETVPMGLARGAQSPEFQRARQAADEFLQAILRKDTGAAITPAEMQEYGRTYIPQPGDAPETLQQKATSRARALAAIQAGMSPEQMLAVERATEATAATQPSDPSWAEGPQVGEIVEGYRYVGGDPGDPSSWERAQ